MIINKLNNILKDYVINVQEEKINKQKKVIKRNEFLLEIEKKLGCFAVLIDDLNLANNLLELSDKLGLSVKIGKNSYVNRNGSSVLGFGFDDNHDVVYLQEAEQALLSNFKPLFSVKENYYVLRNKIRKMAAEKEELIVNKKDVKKTYRTLYLEKASIAQRVKNGFDDLGVSYGNKPSKKEKEVVIEEYDHFIQIGNKIIPKNPNDKIRKINVFV